MKKPKSLDKDIGKEIIEERNIVAEYFDIMGEMLGKYLKKLFGRDEI